MAFIDPYSDAIIISTIPALMVLVVAVGFRQENKKGLYFILGFLSVTEFYIFAIDPSLVAALYTTQGNYTFPLEVSLISGVFLILAVFLFKKHLDA
jgi:hypothetical protein